MPNINQKQLDELQKEVLDQWTDAFSAPPQTQLTQLASIYQSNSSKGHYFLMESYGMWRKWVGARKFRDMASQDFSLKNDDYECSFSLDANVLKDDGIGAFRGIGTNILEGYQKKQQSMLFNLITQNTAIAFDGGVLFKTDRSYNGNTINNLATGALTASTFQTAFETMASYKDHDGEPLAVIPDTLVVGPKMLKTAYDIVKNMFIGDGETSASQIQNFYTTLGIKVVMSPYLVGTYDDYWILASNNTRGVKGVILQERELLPPILSNPQEVMRSNTVDFMASARMAVAPGAPHRIYLGGTSA